jgi:peptidoglycan/LPS O-acetylase OafA/YrhL
MTATQPLSAPHKRSDGIDLLRGVAVLMVMAAHAPFSTQGGMGHAAGTAVPAGAMYPPAAISGLVGDGRHGVELFLVISGYCIHTRWARVGDVAQRIEFLSFWRRRLMRLYPPFALVLAGCVALTVLGARLGALPPIDPRQLGVDVAELLLMVQNATQASIHVGNGPFWSLALEEHLYLLYFPLLFLRRTRGWTAGLLVPLATSTAWITLARVVDLAAICPQWQRMAFFYWFSWALGALAAEVHLGRVTVPRFLSSPLLAAAGFVVGALAPETARDAIVTCSFFPVILWVTRVDDAGILARVPGASALTRLGAISYGVYLVHEPVFVIAKRVVIALGFPMPLVLAARFGAGIAAGYVLFRVVERPFLLRSQRIAVAFARDAPAQVEPGA